MHDILWAFGCILFIYSQEPAAALDSTTRESLKIFPSVGPYITVDFPLAKYYFLVYSILACLTCFLSDPIQNHIFATFQ
jgi:hypothetical protein